MSLPECKAYYTETFPEINDSVWHEVPTLSLKDTCSGNQPAMDTKVQILWSSKYLHVRFDCEDTVVLSDYTEHDEPIHEQEVVEIFLSRGPDDPVRYREFEVSPKNTRFDALISNPTGRRSDMNVDLFWNAMDFQTQVELIPSRILPEPNCDGWIALMSISFQDLSLHGKPPLEGEIWRVNFLRVECLPKAQFCAWSPTYERPANFHIPSYFGILQFTQEAVKARPQAIIESQNVRLNTD